MSSVCTPALLTAAVHSVSVCLSCSSSSWDWQWLSWFFCCRLFSLSYLSTLAVALDAWDCGSSAGEGLLPERCCVGSQPECISSLSGAGFLVTKCLEHTVIAYWFVRQSFSSYSCQISSSASFTELLFLNSSTTHNLWYSIERHFVAPRTLWATWYNTQNHGQGIP